MRDNADGSWHPGKEIKKGQELFLDYGDTYWINDSDDSADNANEMEGNAHGKHMDEDYVGGEEYVEEHADDEEEYMYVLDERSDEDYQP